MPELLANRYELVAKVADGAIAALWRGIARGESGFALPVAVRIVREPWDRERAVLGAWAATATDLAAQASPNVEQALDFVVADGRAYVITEWIDGMSLRRWLADHAREKTLVPWPLAAAIAIAILRALASAHSASPPICHEGIDPRSVRLSRAGTVKLTRFGVASALAVRGAGRRKLEELGLRHAAPELVDGGSSSPAADVYGVGALLFEALAGRPLFAEEPGDARDAAVRSGALPELASARGDLLPELGAVVERALSPDPSARFSSARAMMHALELLLSTAHEATGPEAIAASVAAILDRPRPEVRPTGLIDQRTMHVDVAELTVMPRSSAVAPAEPPPAAEGPPPLPDSPAPEKDDSDSDRRPRYRFAYKERKASLAARERPEPDTAPVPLTRRIDGADEAERPKGLAPQKTEFLDPEQLDRLTIRETSPATSGLAPQKTEYLPPEEVDRLTLRERKPVK